MHIKDITKHTRDDVIEENISRVQSKEETYIKKKALLGSLRMMY